MKAPEHDLLEAHQAAARKAAALPPATNAVTVHGAATEQLMNRAVQAMAASKGQSGPDNAGQADAFEPGGNAGASPSMVRMIMDAPALHVSDIHIETNPGEQFTLIRLRRDGDLELYQKLSPALRSAMVSRIKIMARLDISEHRRPQDGKINFSEFGGDALELRVFVMPKHDGKTW